MWTGYQRAAALRAFRRLTVARRKQVFHCDPRSSTSNERIASSSLRTRHKAGCSGRNGETSVRTVGHRHTIAQAQETIKILIGQVDRRGRQQHAMVR